MGYHLNIIKEDEQKFTLIEIQKALKNSPQFELIESNNDVKIVSKQESNQISIFFHRGMLWSENYSEKIVTSMIELANMLNARVRGDEFETYKTATNTYFHPNDKKLIAQAKKTNKDAYKRGRGKSLLVYISIMLFFVLIIWLVNP